MFTIEHTLKLTKGLFTVVTIIALVLVIAQVMP